MGDLVSALVLLLLAAPKCIVPADQTAGWKQTPIPVGAPALAAPEQVEQFRSGERALVVDEAGRFEHLATTRRRRLVLTFAVPRGTQHLRVRFQHRLDGMEVDAKVYVGAPGAGAGERAAPPRPSLGSEARAMLVLDGRRVAGDEVRLDWGQADVEHVEVTLHHHLRSRPIASEWRAGRWEVVSELADLGKAFRAPGTLNWRHPGGRRIELCDAPEQRLEVRGTRSLEAAKVAVSGREP